MKYIKIKPNRMIHIFISIFIVMLLISPSFSDDNSSQLNDILLIEQNIYNKNYVQEELSSRILRLEQTLFGKNGTGDLTYRLDKLKDYTKVSDIKRSNDSKNILLNLLENRLYNCSYDKEENLKRINRLEYTIFGMNFPNKTESERFEKLLNDVPIKVNTVKVTEINKKTSSIIKSR
jgi:hypothetical protein